MGIYTGTLTYTNTDANIYSLDITNHPLRDRIRQNPGNFKFIDEQLVELPEEDKLVLQIKKNGEVFKRRVGGKYTSATKEELLEHAKGKIDTNKEEK